MTAQPHHRASEAISPLELFFDLVFVFGLTQLSHHLLEHLTWRGFAETVVLLLAIFTVWAYTNWEATLTSVSRRTTRANMLLTMPPILFMNAAIGQAFSDGGWAFVLPYLLVQLGRTFWTRLASADALFREHFTRTLLWIAATVPLWLAGAWAEPDARLWWWLAAASLDLLGTLTAHPLPGRTLVTEGVGFDWEHMQERGRLLFIIALGETVLAAGAAISNAPLTGLTLVLGLAALSIITALWAMAFGTTDKLVTRHLEETRNPIRSTMLSINSLPALMLGLVLLAVASEQAIGHPYGMGQGAGDGPGQAGAGHGSNPLNLLLFGGPLLVIATQVWYQRKITAHWPRTRLLACLALGIAGLVTLSAPPIVSMLLVGAVVGAFALWERSVP